MASPLHLLQVQLEEGDQKMKIHDDDMISIVPLESEKPAEQKNMLLELQLKMATSSINHEYARMEYDDTQSKERQEELLDYMGSCRHEYFEARDRLVTYDPYALEEFEQDLLRQKLQTLSQYHA